MKQTTVMCIFDGEVILTSNTYQVKGGRSKAIMVPNTTSYIDLVKKIHEGGRLPMEQFDIEIKVIYQSIYPIPPVDIADDSDVEAYMNHLFGNMNTVVPLLVTSVCKDKIEVNENVLNVEPLQPTRVDVRSKAEIRMQKKNRKDVDSKLPTILPVDCISTAMPTNPRGNKIVDNMIMDAPPAENIATLGVSRSSLWSDCYPLNAENNNQKELLTVEDPYFGVMIEDYCPLEDFSPVDNYFHVEPIATPTNPKVESFWKESSPGFGGFNLNDFPPEVDEFRTKVFRRSPSIGCEAIEALFNTTDDDTIVPETSPSKIQPCTKQQTRRKGKSKIQVEDKSRVKHEEGTSIKEKFRRIGKSKIQVEDKSRVKNEEGTSINNWIEVNVPNKEISNSKGNAGEDVQLVLNSDHKQIVLDQVFVDKDALVIAAKKYALYSNMMFKTVYSTKHRFTIACVVPTCPWRLHASRIAETKLFKISSFANVHECSIPIRGADHKQATSKLICDFIKQRFHTDVAYSPLEIIRDISIEFGVKLSYRKAWLAREKAIQLRRGTYAESYSLLLPYFYELRKQNPGTITKICRDGERFLRAFVAFGPCVSAFRKNHIRPVIAIDASHMKAKYRGVCFTATSLDGNDQLFQVAVGVGEAENNDSWNWFLSNLKDAIGDIPRDLVIISDRHQAILQQVPRVFPGTYHAWCAFHILQNLFARFKTESCNQFFWLAVKAFKRSEFLKFMEIIKGLSVDIYDWLNAIDKEHWTNAYCPAYRYGIVTSNSCESTNNVLSTIKDLPICMFFEEYRLMIQKKWWERKKFASTWSTRLTMWGEELMSKAFKKSRATQCLPINLYEAFVRTVDGDEQVNLANRSCTCGEYAHTGFPCEHAVSAISHYKHDPYLFVAHYYTIENYCSTYEESIYPPLDRSHWDTPADVLAENLLPPRAKTLPGRPKKLRILSQGENPKKSVRCGRCRGYGHNRKHCSNVVHQVKVSNTHHQVKVEPARPSGLTEPVERAKSTTKRKATTRRATTMGKRVRNNNDETSTMFNFL